MHAPNIIRTFWVSALVIHSVVMPMRQALLLLTDGNIEMGIYDNITDEAQRVGAEFQTVRSQQVLVDR